ncbi:glycosyltransferase family 2 protein [Defluviitalea saccharophila]|uniref:Glycosyltransferase n=1 Tax=Defluviitalea saccharophila TaxID=879970 RepID=A0ABZ2Y3W8_9FIRM
MVAITYINNPEVSVVLPIYNSEEYIEETLESILSQSYKNFELIIINDGSTDRSLDIINSFTRIDDRIIFLSRRNKGLVCSLNEGISLARGKYIARCDADDINYQDRFEKQVKFLNENDHIDIVGTKVEVIGEVEESIKVKRRAQLNIDIDEFNGEEKILTYWHCLAHSSVMFRKTLIDRIGGYRDYKSEDLELWIRALKNGHKIKKLDDVLIQCRIHGQSKSNLENINYEGIEDAMRIKLNYLEEKGTSFDQYMIWGLGSGGRLAYKVLKECYPMYECTGFIDSYKSGQYNNIPIYNPQQINDFRTNYMFIATELGKEDSINRLNALDMKNIDNYLCLV